MNWFSSDHGVGTSFKSSWLISCKIQPSCQSLLVLKWRCATESQLIDIYEIQQNRHEPVKNPRIPSPTDRKSKNPPGNDPKSKGTDMKWWKRNSLWTDQNTWTDRNPWVPSWTDRSSWVPSWMDWKSIKCNLQVKYKDLSWAGHVREGNHVQKNFSPTIAQSHSSLNKTIALWTSLDVSG